MHLVPVILCGGAGSRLWPVSRELHPKPFIRLADGESLLQKAFLRSLQLPELEEILVVTNRELFFKAKDELCELNLSKVKASFILEPVARNTAAAIAAASLQVAKLYGEEAILLILAADHLITDVDAFSLAVNKAVELAQTAKLVTFGIQPDAPETAYGYIETENNRVLGFVEKPSLEQAQSYIESGRFLWNSGMFCFAAGTLLREMQLHCPDILAAVRKCMDQSRRMDGKEFSQLDLDPNTFKEIPDNSIDYALMEKSDQIAVVPCSIGWSDIGSWDALSKLTTADAKNNRVEGEALLFDAANCYVQSHERLVAAVGVENLLIIDTPDALLVADKARAQDVKHLYAELKIQGHEAHKLHRTVHRPWGSYTVLQETKSFKIKRLVVKPGASLSLQLHRHRSEHWVVVSGIAKVVNGERELIVNTNESTFIPAGQRHRLENPAAFDLIMIEVQSGDYVGEDDIVRFEDIYGRVEEGS